MRFLLGVLVALAATWLSTPAFAASDLYNVTLTTVAEGAFQDTRSGLILLSQVCPEYVYGEDAILRWDGTGSVSNEIIFREEDETCDVEGLYRTNAVLTHVAQDVYHDSNTGGYLRTELCLVLARDSDALILSDRVIFVDDRDECDLAP